MNDEDQLGTPTEARLPARAWISCAIVAALLALLALLIIWMVGRIG